MDVDWSVDLGADDPNLAVPWASPDGSVCYHDLRARPDLLLYIDEASRYRELGEFLVAVNSQNSFVQSAKCDVWTSRELNEAEEIYGGPCKLCSYIDLIFCDTTARADFSRHELFAKNLTELLQRAPDISAA